MKSSAPARRAAATTRLWSVARTGAVSLVISGEDADNAQTYSTTNGDISSRASTAATVAWTPADWNTVGERGLDQQTENIAAIIQEIVDRAGWTSGDAIALTITGNGKRAAESFNGSQAGAPLLHIEYALPDDGIPRIDLDANDSSGAVTSDFAANFYVGTTPVAIADSDTLITVWGQTVELAQEGWWGAQLAIEQGDERHEGLRLRFFVVAEGKEPAVGEPAPATRQPTLADGVDIDELSTAQPPNPEMHRLAIADALALDQPLVVTFATPAFCQTRFCGPVLEQVVTPLAERYDGQAVFVHIEPFDLAGLRTEGTFAPVPAMEEWGLSTEPWVFVVDAQGLVAAKFEGVVSQEEIAEVLERLGL